MFAILDGQVERYTHDGTYEGVYGGDGALHGQPIVTDDALIVTSVDHTFLYDLSHRDLLDQLDVGGEAVVSNGHLYLVDGTVVRAFLFSIPDAE